MNKIIVLIFVDAVSDKKKLTAKLSLRYVLDMCEGVFRIWYFLKSKVICVQLVD